MDVVVAVDNVPDTRIVTFQSGGAQQWTTEISMVANLVMVYSIHPFKAPATPAQS